MLYAFCITETGEKLLSLSAEGTCLRNDNSSRENTTKQYNKGCQHNFTHGSHSRIVLLVD